MLVFRAVVAILFLQNTDSGRIVDHSEVTKNATLSRNRFADYEALVEYLQSRKSAVEESLIQYQNRSSFTTSICFYFELSDRFRVKLSGNGIVHAQTIEISHHAVAPKEEM